MYTWEVELFRYMQRHYQIIQSRESRCYFVSSTYNKTARTLRHRTEACRSLLYIQSCAQYRAIFEDEVQDTIGIHRDFFHHGIPQRRREFGDSLISVRQLFSEGREHFTLWGTTGAFGLDDLKPISSILITLCQCIVSGRVFTDDLIPSPMFLILPLRHRCIFLRFIRLAINT